MGCRKTSLDPHPKLMKPGIVKPRASHPHTAKFPQAFTLSCRVFGIFPDPDLPPAPWLIGNQKAEHLSSFRTWGICGTHYGVPGTNQRF